MSKLPFSTAKMKQASLRVRLPWGSIASVVIALVVWWKLAGLAGISAITPRDHGPVLPLAAPLLADTDWPAWRGGTRQGTISAGATLPAQWTLPDNVRPIGVQDALSPPCVTGDAIILVWQSRHAQQTWLTCQDRMTGTFRWRAELQNDLTAEITKAISTPACDGSRVFVTTAYQGDLLVTAFSLTGELLWSRSAGPIGRAVGPAQSPVIGQSLVYVAVDQRAAPWQWNGAGGFVAALHRQTGRIVWRTPRASGDGYATPVVATLGGRRQLVLPGRGSVRSYDAETGQELWFARWSARLATASVVCDELHVFATTSSPERETLCVRADGAGDVSETHVLWRAKYAGGIAGPALVDGSVVIVQEDGGVTALDRQNGRVVWQERMPSRFSTSPLVAGSRLYCFDDAGGVTVLDAQQHGHVIAHNQTPGPHTVAVSRGQFLFATPAGITTISADGPTQVAHEVFPGRIQR